MTKVRFLFYRHARRVENGVLRHGDVAGDRRGSRQGQASAEPAGSGGDTGQRRGVRRQSKSRRDRRRPVDRKPAGRPDITPGSAKTDDREPDERGLQEPRLARVPRWVPHPHTCPAVPE